MSQWQNKLEHSLNHIAHILSDYPDGKVTSLQVDFQDSGEHPYRIFTTEQELPQVGVAGAAQLRDPDGTSKDA